MTDRIRFSQAELDSFYTRIALPQHKRVYDITALPLSQQLTYLSLLLKHTIIRIPFENLTQHYSWHRVVEPNPQHVLQKITSSQNPGRGGYCMENNSVFATVLLSLGYRAYNAPARVKVPGGWSPLSHIVVLVMLGDGRYLCDVGFGNNEATVPVRLEHGTVESQIRPTQNRLVHEVLEEYEGDYKMWVLQTRRDETAEWEALYCFSEMELLPGDIVGLNYGPWKGRTSIFVRNIMVVRYTAGEEAEFAKTSTESIEANEIDGILIINNEHFKWRRKGKTLLDKMFKSEDERLETLERYWGMKFEELDRQAIRSSSAAITSKHD